MSIRATWEPKLERVYDRLPLGIAIQIFFMKDKKLVPLVGLYLCSKPLKNKYNLQPPS